MEADAATSHTAGVLADIAPKRQVRSGMAARPARQSRPGRRRKDDTPSRHGKCRGGLFTPKIQVGQRLATDVEALG